uniref:G_PROTEIN_RECEP_F1_2 domain-containing protein n=1 Tax=Rhabditophanes sp. KR3021 TaxID=114890 RepID=A0AC35TZ24_9BILA
MGLMNNSQYTVFMYDTRMTSIFTYTSYALVINLLYGVGYGVIINFIPISKELLKSKKEAKFDTVRKIEQAMKKITTIFYIPIFIGLSPFAVGFIVLNILRISVSKDVERWVGAGVVIGPIMYYIIAPLVTIYTIRGSKRSRKQIVAVKPLG